MTDTNTRIDWLDSLRAIAIIAVIVIHVSSPVVNVAYGSNMFHWWVGNVLDSAARFAVPLFLNFPFLSVYVVWFRALFLSFLQIRYLFPFL